MIQSHKQAFYAIPDSNTDNRVWNIIATQAEVKYNWNHSGINQRSSKENILSGILQQNKGIGKKKAGNLTDGIYYFSRLKGKDVVLIFDQHMDVKLMGVIRSVLIFPGEVIVKMGLKPVNASSLTKLDINASIQKIEVRSGVPAFRNVSSQPTKLNTRIKKEDAPKTISRSALKGKFESHGMAASRSLGLGGTFPRTGSGGAAKKAAPKKAFPKKSAPDPKKRAAQPKKLPPAPKKAAAKKANAAPAKKDKPNAKIVITKAAPETLAYKYEMAMIGDGGGDLFAPISTIQKKDNGSGIVNLFYGTNRKRTNDSKPNNYFDNQVDKLLYGHCEVNIPKGHVHGNVERPEGFLFIKLWESEKKHIVLKKITELSKKDFISTLSKSLTPNKSALVFIHGYNVTFAEAARQAGQIAWDIPYGGLMGFFSWPSTGKAKSYAADEAKARTSMNHLATYIEDLIDSGLEELHLVAHSMGSLVLAGALGVLYKKQSFAGKLHKIKQVIMGAPDIDAQEFENMHLQDFINVGQNRTIYTSDNDMAIYLSERIRGGRRRLGDAGDTIFVSKGIDTIDATGMEPNWLGHSYIFQVRALLMDLFQLVSRGVSPKDRNLREKSIREFLCWFFP